MDYQIDPEEIYTEKKESPLWTIVLIVLASLLIGHIAWSFIIHVI